jgi:hypothetical protein
MGSARAFGLPPGPFFCRWERSRPTLRERPLALAAGAFVAIETVFPQAPHPRGRYRRRAGDSHAKEAPLCLPRFQLEEEP